MLKDSIVFNDRFWQILQYVDSLSGKVSFKEFDARKKITDDELYEVISFLAHYGYEVTIFEEDGERFIKVPSDGHRINFSLSFSEWISLQAHFPLMDQHAGNSFHHSIGDKFFDLEQEYSNYSLFKYIDDKKKVVGLLEQKYQEYLPIIRKIEYAISNQHPFEVDTEDNKKIKIFAHRLVFLDEGLAVIGEGVTDKHICYFAISEIKDIRVKLGMPHSVNFSSIEIDEFISAIRSVTGNEYRLILKIPNGDYVNINPKYHFLGNPYVTSNMNGDVIWAASVELSDDLLAWLWDINGKIEILDPSEVRNAFIEYCEKIIDEGEKKAS